ncbi:hypothetical protein [Azospirillum largimobile]
MIARRRYDDAMGEIERTDVDREKQLFHSGTFHRIKSASQRGLTLELQSRRT